jgi:hypothetical protein
MDYQCNLIVKLGIVKRYFINFILIIILLQSLVKKKSKS